MAYEDDKTWCEKWLPVTHPDCVLAPEFDFVSSSQLESVSVAAGINTYGGGGYIIELRGYIDDLKARIVQLQQMKWTDNRTRSLALEFSVYNAQVTTLL